jgi:hypothetical protein
MSSECASPLVSGAEHLATKSKSHVAGNDRNVDTLPRTGSPTVRLLVQYIALQIKANQGTH